MTIAFQLQMAYIIGESLQYPTPCVQQMSALTYIHVLVTSAT